MSYSLYKPLANNDINNIQAIMRIFKKTYYAIGFFILLLGLFSAPWIDLLVKNKSDVSELNYIFMLFVINTAISYFYSYKRILLIAAQKEFMVIRCSMLVQCAVLFAQIIFLYITKSYWSFILLMIMGTCIENYWISVKADNKYPYLKSKKIIKLSQSIAEDIKRNIKAMILHQLSRTIVFSSPNVILAKVVGLTATALYGNYYMVIGALDMFLARLYDSMVPTIGNLLTESNKGQNQQSCHRRDIIDP